MKVALVIPSIAVIALLATEAASGSTTSSGGTQPCKLKGEWKTVDSLITTQDSMIGAIASVGNKAYAVGGSAGHWITRRSENSGESWTTVDEVSGPGHGLGVAVDPVSGAIYTVGRVAGEHNWVVRKSSDGGDNWTTIDDLIGPVLGGTPSVQKVAVDGLGNVYVIGRIAKFDGGPAFLRRSENGGAIWQTIDVGGGMEFAQNVVGGPSGEAFVAGVTLDPVTSAGRWLVRHSPNGKDDWITADLVTVPWIGSFVVDGAISKSGRVTFVGLGATESGGRLLVREASLSAPTSWSQLAEYRPTNSAGRAGTALAMGVTFAENGDLVVSGEQTPAGSAFVDSIALQIRSSGKIKLTDVVPHPAIHGEQHESGPGIGAISTLADGSVLAGHVVRMSSSYAWIVRKQNCK